MKELKNIILVGLMGVGCLGGLAALFKYGAALWVFLYIIGYCIFGGAVILGNRRSS